jgi:hypothetical protein
LLSLSGAFVVVFVFVFAFCKMWVGGAFLLITMGAAVRAEEGHVGQEIPSGLSPREAHQLKVVVQEIVDRHKIQDLLTR